MAGDNRKDDYRQARIGAAAALVVVVLLILLIDAINVDYEASPIVVGAILGTIAALMGVEIIGWRP